MTRLKRKQQQDFFMNIFLAGFFPAVIFGGFAYHFLFGTGYFGGLEVDTMFWGSLSFCIAVPCALICLYGLCKSIGLQEVK